MKMPTSATSPWRLTIDAPKKIDLDICRLDLDLNIGPYYISGNIHLVIEDIAVRRID